MSARLYGNSHCGDETVMILSCLHIRNSYKMIRWHLYIESDPRVWTYIFLSWWCHDKEILQYSDVIMGVMASQITSLTIVYWTVYSGAEQRKHQGSASLAFMRGIQRWLVNSPHKWPVTWKMCPFDDVIMSSINSLLWEKKIHWSWDRWIPSTRGQ